MGKRARKRADGPSRPSPRAATPEPPPAPAAVSRRAKLDELPAPPWAPFPLVELVILLGLVLMLVGVFAGGDRQGPLIVGGVALAALAGLEQAIREHFAGFRSHTTLIAGAVGFACGAIVAVAGGTKGLVLIVAVAVFAGAFGILRRAFMHRTGGLGFRA
jgi:hypothetical protein